MRVALLGLGLLLLISDAVQDWAFFQSAIQMDMSWVLAAVVRNLLMVVVMILLARGGRYAPVLLLFAAAMGLVRRIGYLLPALTAQLDLGLLHSGADLAFRLLLLGAAWELWRESK